MLRKIRKLIAPLGLLGLAAVQCGAAVVFVDTIGDGSKYQIGGEIARRAEVGFERCPASGDFTGLRPVYHDFYYWNTQGLGYNYQDHDATVSPLYEFGVTSNGASGVPIAPAVGCWVAQPFVPARGGVVCSVSVVAQNRHSAGFSDQAPDGQRALSVYIVPSSGWPIASETPGAAFRAPFGNAGVGKVVSGSSFSGAAITAGETYYLLVGIGAPGVDNWTGDCESANLNWAWKSLVPDGSKVSSLLQDMNNARGAFTALTDRIIGFSLRGYETPPEVVPTGEAKGLSDGTPVRLDGVVVNGKTGAVGPDFYVEDPQRPSGIRVVGKTDFVEGEHVNALGTVTTLPSGEKAIRLDAIESSGVVDPVEPLFANIRNAKSGVDMTGLLVRLAGNVVSVAGATFVLSDGSDDAGIACVGVAGWSSLPTLSNVGQMREVTGVLSRDGAGSKIVLIRKAQDIEP